MPSLEGSWIYTRVNVKVHFVFISTSGFIDMFWVIITFMVYTVLVLLLRYIYSWCVGDQRVLKLCPVVRDWVSPLLVYCWWGLLWVTNLPVRTLACCFYWGNVAINLALAGKSQRACLNSPVLGSGVSVCWDTERGQWRWVRTWHPPRARPTGKQNSYLPVTRASQGPKTPGRNKYFRSQNPKAR